MKNTYIILKAKRRVLSKELLMKKSKIYLTTIFEDVRLERSVILLLSLTHPEILRQSKFTDQ